MEMTISKLLKAINAVLNRYTGSNFGGPSDKSEILRINMSIEKAISIAKRANKIRKMIRGEVLLMNGNL